ncbi:RabGAP/TBC [Amniculicola lignicola CBS 123094]|uniref:RabGAP/TBC n=1 Tax=Amniculicola lignicola CBS 123094 TaxID=1392246 RepID=A0A6A5X0Z0_9PLEO|nr:RabGAP/TBC [Amniculicola lignicola CBS 123094]
MDAALLPVYERTIYSPSPSSSPPLPPLPSPHFVSRQRAPSLLRQATASSPLSEGHARAEQPIAPPTSPPIPSPTRQRIGPGPGLASDPRTIFNPLASNPVNLSGPAWRLSREEKALGPQTRARGYTSSSQPGYPHPPLRAATSIPDYAPYRGADRSNPTSTYRPNRGGTNWSHVDNGSMRNFFYEEPRASFRSAWTNASSSFIDASGTERSSFATGRSSISENRVSGSSLEHSLYQKPREEVGRSPGVPEAQEDDDETDIINSYYYDEEDLAEEMSFDTTSQRRTASPVSTLDIHPVPLQSNPTALQSLTVASTHEEAHHLSRDFTFREKTPRNSIGQKLVPTSPLREPQPKYDIYKDIISLPKLPQKKSRLSRQDWAEIQQYSKRRGKSKDSLGDISGLSSTVAEASKKPAAPLPPIKQSDPLPEVDEEDAYPRRASTSVFDRKSTLFQLGKIAQQAPMNSRTQSGDDLKPKDKRGSGRSLSGVTVIGSARNMSLGAIERDRYGFKKQTDKISVDKYNAWEKPYTEYVGRRRNKWVTLMRKQGMSIDDPTVFPEKSDKVKRYARKGFPPEWRGAMWWFYSGGPEELSKMRGVYFSLLRRLQDGELDKDDREAIERDLDRTFPDNVRFRPDNAPDTQEEDPERQPEMIKRLREVLQCFALNNPGIGYCQSLNFIAGLLLIFIDDVEQVFVLLTIITKYHLPGAHARNLANTDVSVLMMLIKDYLPKIWNSINDTDLINEGRGAHAHPASKYQRLPSVSIACTSWFMSLFINVLPIEVVCRVWDAFLFEGSRALFLYALSIFKMGETEIRGIHPSNMPEMCMAIQDLPRRSVDPNVLYELAFVKKGFGSVSATVVEKKRQFWREQSGRKSLSRVPNQKDGGAVREEEVNGEKKRPMDGLRRKASKRFLRRGN